MSKDVNLRLAAIIRDARNRAGMSQEHLADAAEISAKTVRRIESGERISHEKLRDICAVLHLDVTTVLDGASSPSGERRFYQTNAKDLRRPEASGLVYLTMFLSGVLVMAMPLLVLYPETLSDDDIKFSALGLTVLMAASWMVGFVFWECFEIEERLIVNEGHVPFRGYVIILAAFLPSCAAKILHWVIGIGEIERIGILSLAFVGYWAALLYESCRCSRILSSLVSQARASLSSEGAEIIASLRTLAADRVRRNVLEEAEELLERYRHLARSARQYDGCRAVECFMEDLANGISGTEGLMDYLDLAAALDTGKPLTEREKSDADQMLSSLQLRVSALTV